MCVFMYVDLVGEWEERSFFLSSLFCFELIFVFVLLTLPDPPRINVDGMICNRCMYVCMDVSFLQISFSVNSSFLSFLPG